MRYVLTLWLVLVLPVSASSGDTGYIYQKSTQQPLDEVNLNLYKSLEDSRFYVIFEGHIGKNLARIPRRGMRTTIAIISKGCAAW